jgi:hypothetical protein
MTKELEEFSKSFVPGDTMAACTWYWDVTPEFVDQPFDKLVTEGLVPWGTQLDLDTQDLKLVELRLASARLKWHMDVEEMFYVGDNHVEPEWRFGLLRHPVGVYSVFEDSTGDSTLVSPSLFGELIISGNLKDEQPCKWLTLPEVDKSRFSYCRTKLLFRLCWPKLYRFEKQEKGYLPIQPTDTSSKDTIVYLLGGIAPLKFK